MTFNALVNPSWLLGCALFVSACDEKPEPAASVPTPSEPIVVAPEPAPEVKIEYDTKIETADGKSTVYWTAKVPTGGWTMTTDQAPLVEESGTLWWVRVWVTLEAPDPKDMVTQGFETLTGKYEADRKIDRVEFSVRRKVKGVKYDFAPLYGVVKRGVDWVTDEDKKQ